MTGVSFSIYGMDAMTTSWWTCVGCASEAELPTASTAGCQVPCPDCGVDMAEQWSWDTAAA